MRNQTSSPDRKSGRRRAVRALSWLAAALGVLALLLGATALIMVKTEWGARTAWQTISRMAPGQLSGEFAGGTLGSGIRLRNVTYRNDSMLVKIDRLESSWRLVRSPLALTVDSLRIGSADVTLLPSERPQSPSPRAMPRQIMLPLAIDLQSATIRQLVLHRGTESSRYRDISLHGSSDRVQHRLVLEKAVTPYGTATAALRLNGVPPFETGGAARLEGEIREQSYRIDTRLSGTLQSLGIQIDVAGDKLDGRAEIDATPFAAVPFRRARIDISNLDPKAFNPEWPHADLEIHASLTPAGAAANGSLPAVGGPVSITNARPGAIDKGLLPLVSARADVKLDTALQQLSQVKVRLPGNATLQGGGEIRGKGEGKLALQADGLDLHALHTALRPTRLDGPLIARFAGGLQHVNVKLAGPSLSATAEATLSPQRIALHGATLRAGPAQLDIVGTLARDAEAAYSVNGKMTRFNPFLFLSSMQRTGAKGPAVRNRRTNASINTEFQAKGVLRPKPSAQIKFNVYDSTYDNLPMTGGGTLQIAGKRLLSSDVQLSIAGNDLLLKGGFGRPQDGLRFEVNAPALARLGFGLSGLLRVDGRVEGSLQRPVIDARYHAENLAFGPYRLAWLSGEAHTRGMPGATPQAAVELDLRARGLESDGIVLNQLAANIDGTYASHTMQVTSTGRVRGKPLQLRFAAQGRLEQRPQGMAWNGTLQTLENRGVPRVSMASPLPVSLAPGRIELGASRLTIAQAAVDLKRFVYSSASLQSEGSFSALDIGHLLALRRQFTGSLPPVDTDLVLDGSWNLTLADRADGFVQVARRSGDIRITGDSAVGLTELSARADLQGTRIALDGQVRAVRIGNLTGKGQIALQRSGGRLAITPGSPIEGRIAATIPRLSTIGFLIGPKIGLDGSAALNLSVDGTIADPRFSGAMTGDRLALTLYDQGIRLRDGTARVNLDNNVAELEQVVFHGGGGTLRVTGRVPLKAADHELTATMTADNFQLFSSPARHLILSGQAQATNVDRQLLITGKFVVDRALFSMPEKAAPRLGDDVIVYRGNQAPERAAGEEDNLGEQRAGPLSPRVNVQVGLGDDFRFEGSGADLLLAGTVTIQSAPGETLQAFGTVRVVEGSYEAFGTELAIERGIINFQGPVGNPNINILAMRRDEEVDAGVQVTGTVQRPRVQLVSEPNVSDEEKLSWLVFGRGGGEGGSGQAQAAARGAALGLLNKFGGQRIAKGFGLDELSIGASEFGLAGQQVVNLGKEISDRLYIGYEQSVASAESVLKLTYELTRNWSIVLRGGTVTGVDMRYSKRFDRIQ